MREILRRSTVMGQQPRQLDDLATMLPVRVLERLR
jgi:hypothetical protein